MLEVVIIIIILILCQIKLAACHDKQLYYQY